MHNEEAVTGLTLCMQKLNTEAIFNGIARETIEVLARRLFSAIFPIWLSDLHIGRIIVLKGANLVRFENEPAALALSLWMKVR